MATIPYRDIIGSRPFKFLVGPDRKEFTMHSSLVARQSEALNALVNGHFREAEEQCVVWEDLDEETFLRFSQFAYTGSYDGAQPQRRAREEDPGPQSPRPSARPPWSSSPGQRSKKRRCAHCNYPVGEQVKKETMWNRFCSLHGERGGGEAGAPPRDADGDHGAVFLSHARVYVFADYHGVADLQAMALGKLARALVEFRLADGGAGGVARLVEYVFGNTVDKAERDPLRDLVCTYTACKMEELWAHDEFKGLMDTVDEFPQALVAELLHRLD